MTKKIRDDSRRPRFRVFLGSDVGYYHPDAPFRGVTKEEAAQFFHKEANNTRNYMHRTIGYKGAAIEEVET